MRLKVLAVAIFVLATTISPAQAAPNYVFPIVGCDYTYAKAHHEYPATDILAKAGCKYVAVTSGVIDEVNRIDSWSGKTNLGVDRGGLYVSFIGDDGVRYYASHLKSSPKSIESGVVVRPGQVIKIADPLKAGIRRAGRINAATTTQITIDNTDQTDVTNLFNKEYIEVAAVPLPKRWFSLGANYRFAL